MERARKSECKLLCAPPEGASYVWPIVQPFVEKAFAAVDARVPVDLFQRMCNGTALVWMVYDGDEIVYVFITELYERPSGIKVCSLLCGAGSRMDEWLHLQSEVEAYARAEGCAKIVAEGRVGWARALSGYTEIRRVIEKDL